MGSKSFRKQGVKVQILCMCLYIIFNFYVSVSSQVYSPLVAERQGVEYAWLINWVTYGNLIGVVLVFISGRMAAAGIKCKNMAGVAVIFAGINYILIPIYPTPALAGFGLAFNAMIMVFYTHTTVPLILGKWYPRKHAHVFGNVTAAIIVASLVLLPLFNRVNNVLGLVPTMIIFGLPAIVVGFVLLFFVKETPQELGLEPDGIAFTEEELAEREALAAETAAYNAKSKWTAKAILTNPRVWFAGLGWGFFMLAMSGFSTVGISFINSRGIASAAVITIASFVGVLNFAGSVGSGYISEKIGHMKASVLIAACIAVGALIMALSGSSLLGIVIGYYVFQLAVGAGNNMSGTSALVLGGPKDQARFWTYIGTIMMIVRAFYGSYGSICLTYFGGYDACVIAAVILGVLSMILIALAGDKRLTPPAEK